ncbi:MAG: zf-HC2 domain-containing protein [Acidimicrobiia bacterium]
MSRLRALFLRVTRRDTLVCRDVVELVTDYVEGVMAADERRRLDRHLAGCRGCQSFLDQMRRTVQLSGKITEDDVRALPAETLRPLVDAYRELRRGTS